MILQFQKISEKKTGFRYLKVFPLNLNGSLPFLEFNIQSF